MVDLPQAPASVIDADKAREIRSYLREQKSAVDFIMKQLADRDILTAVLTAKPFLSGLTDVQFNLVRERCRSGLYPEQQNLQEWLAKALDDLRNGVEAARLLVCERCDLRLDDDGQARPIRSPLPKPALVAG
jgi:predicted AAA+ superfamily ATPase